MIGTTALIYLATVAAGQAVSLLLLPVITHYLPPADFGEYALVLAITTLVGTFGSSWVRNVAMRLYFERVPEGTTRSLFWTAAGLQFVTTSVLLAAGYALAEALGQGVGGTVYLAGGVSLLVADFYALSGNTLRGAQRAASYGAAEFTSALLRLAGTWIGLELGYRSPALLFMFATGSVLAAQAVASLALARVLEGTASFDRAAVSELLRLGLPSIPHAVGGWVMSLSDRTVLAHFGGLSAVGVYSVAYSIADRSVGGLMAGLYLMAWPAMLQSWSDDRERAPRRISYYLGVYAALTAGPAVLLALEREFILGLLVSEEYTGAAGVVPFVVAGAWLTGVSAYLNRPLELGKRYALLSGITMAAAAINIVLNLALIPDWGAQGAAIATATACGVLVVLSAIFGAQVAPVPMPWKPLGVAAGATTAAVLAAAPWSSPLAAIPTFAGVYALSVGLGWTWVRRENRS